MKMQTSFRSLIKPAVFTLAVAIGAAGFLGSRFGPEMAGASAQGPAASHTNAPGEGNCTACHTDFALNSGPGAVTISGVPANYRAGQSIPLTVTATDPNAVVFGFQMTAVDSQGRAAGTFSFAPAVPQPLQTVFGIVNGNQRQYIEHTIDGIVPTMFGTKSWNFTWTAPARRVGKISFHAANNAANSDGNTSGDYIYATSKASLSGTAISNFDSDGRSDVAIWRPSSGTWYPLNSTDLNYQAVTWGIAGDRVAPGDYDGDGKTDIAMWRPSTGVWYVVRSSNGSIFSAQFGVNGDVPVPGDYDGDLKSDLAVWRPSTGVWYIYRSSDAGVSVISWGVSTDKTAQGDFDGDGKTDVAIYRPSTGAWYVFRSADNSVLIAAWGAAGDRPVQADYDGDGRHDLAVFRPSNGTWFIFNSSNSTATIAAWGAASDVPVPADYDGDGRSDISVYRNGVWYILQSSTNSFTAISWGISGDLPIPAAYISD
jgi:hypothetical protein